MTRQKKIPASIDIDIILEMFLSHQLRVVYLIIHFLHEWSAQENINVMRQLAAVNNQQLRLPINYKSKTLSTGTISLT